VYPIPYRYYADYGIRRFGFHGMSHKYVSRRAAQFLGKTPRDLKMITCHLGAGASLCAIDHGVSMDTSMGYTPLDGIMMGTRSGSVDPAIITAIMEKEGLSPFEMDQILNRESGMLGVSGVSGDLRRLKEAVAVGDDQAELAYDIFLTSIRRMIGAYFFELAGVDVIVCTAGVGENDSYARRLIFRGLEPFGIRIDQERNNAEASGDRRISADDSQVEVLVIPTDEEAEIARDACLIARGVDISDPWSFVA
ncbi:MAG: acetate/propionate family kinase, partial [Coriobacteriia bacterium]|nr:acetate/propionate family kinase [Coriobacteriia bacterium]